MRWVRDLTGRFPRRPHYEQHELDAACDELIGMRQEPRLSTDALMVLIERHAADLDLYADLSAEGADVEAVTDFVPGQRPRVRISEQLSSSPRREHRLRTTLAHELAHVVFHNFIWWFDQGTLDTDRAKALSPRCHRRTLGTTDWMEWQANYAAGALLMPASAIAHYEPVWVRSLEGRRRVERVRMTFDVSMEAARVRLKQLGRLTDRPTRILKAPIPKVTNTP